MLFDFLATILEHNLTEIGYEADTAQLEYTLKTEESGLVMKMNGFNDKLPVSVGLLRGKFCYFYICELVSATRSQLVAKTIFSFDLLRKD